MSIGWLYKSGCTIKEVEKTVEAMKVGGQYLALATNEWVLLSADPVDLRQIVQRQGGTEPFGSRFQKATEPFIAAVEPLLEMLLQNTSDFHNYYMNNLDKRRIAFATVCQEKMDTQFAKTHTDYEWEISREISREIS